MSPRRIGILGGMGPEATVLLMQKLIDATPAQDDAGHIPLIVDQTPQVPSRLAHLIDGTGPNPAPELAQMAKRLEAAGAAALAMPCNTAHHYAPAIRDVVKIPLLNMIELVSNRVETTGQTQVGILGSPALRRVGVFENALKPKGVDIHYPKDEAALLTAIRQIKADGPSNETRNILKTASEALLDQGTSLQLIACTEFSLIADAVPSGVQAIDTLDVLIDGITEFALETRA